MWAQMINILLGLWVMISPALLNYNQTIANNNHIAGPLIITFAVVSLWEVNRNVRVMNIVTGAWMIASVFLLPADSTIALISNGIAGLLILIFSFVKRPTNDAYGGGWSSLFQKNPLHLQAAEKSNS